RSEVQGVIDAMRVKATSSFELAYNTACALVEKNKLRRLEEQVKQHNKKREATASEGKGPKADDDESYKVNLNENFLAALGYRMPPALGMTLLSELSKEVGFLVTNTSFDALLESLLSTANRFLNLLDIGY
ncbi:hypothetical protein Tco_1444754, partial [Tanacetum coccineum]